MEKLGITKLLTQTFKGKRVFLTGHTGFKGSWFLLLLKELGAEVYGFSLAPKKETDLFNQIQGETLCKHQIGDIRDQATLEKAITEFQPDFVFHLAAQALVIESYHNPVDTYSTNVMGTVHVLDAIKKLEKPCISVIITTDKVYENLEREAPYKENERLGGFDPYSNSKACAELAVSSYRNSFFNPANFSKHQQSVSSARSGNVIGGGDWSDNRIVPDLVRALKTNKTLTIRNPNAVRPWQHVLDPLLGYLMLAAKQAIDPIKFAGGFNFGPSPNDELTVKELIETGITIWGSGSYETPELKEKLHEAGLLKLSIEKAQKELGWSPQLTAQEAIELTLNWYKEAEDNPRAFTEMQIAHYLNNLK